MVEVAGDRAGPLKDIAAASSVTGVFDAALLKTLRWASLHYVAPLPVLLDRASPPNLPSGSEPPPSPVLASTPNGTPHPIRDVAREVSDGSRRPTTVVVGNWHELEWIDAFGPVLGMGRSVMIVAATEAESRTVAERATAAGLAVTEVSGEVARHLTDQWEAVQHPGRLVVGTPRVATWQVAGLSMAVVLEEGRRAMKDRQTPTVHVRDLMLTRSRVEGFSLVFYGPTPSVEVLASGPGVVRHGRRAWALVEAIDRSADQPGSGFLSERVIAALRAMAASGRRSFVFTHRRAADSSMRCVECRQVRVCRSCGSRLGREPACRRCSTPSGPCARCGGASFEEMGSEPERLVVEVNRRIGRETAALHPTDRLVSVGTERDLATLAPVPLAVAVDVDGLMLGHNYRNSEEALRVLARLANSVEPGHGRRMMAQTSMPDSPLITALRRGDPIPYLEEVLAERARQGFPPASEMVAVEVRGEEEPGRFDRDLRGLGDITVLGPAQTPQGARWLLQGALGQARVGLRPMVQRWRESGVTVRIDADPIDL